MIEVAITPNSLREWRSRGAIRYWIVASGWTDVEIKKNKNQIADWSYLPEDLQLTRRLIDRAERFNSDWLKVKVGCQSGIFVSLLDSCLFCYWSCISGSHRQTTVTSQTRDFPLCHGTNVCIKAVSKKIDSFDLHYGVSVAFYVSTTAII